MSSEVTSAGISQANGIMLPSESFLSTLRYNVTYFFTSLTTAFGFSMRAEGSGNMPLSGPVLLVSNHQSYLDPLLLGVASRRQLCYLARKNLFDNPVFAWIIRGLNAVPIDSAGIGKDGLKAVLDLLASGRAVVVFPEGHRTRDGLMQELKPGIQLLLKRTQATVVPAGIAGAYRAWPPGTSLPKLSPLFCKATPRCIAVSIGKPLDSSALARLPRDQVLRVLDSELRICVARAERLQRK